MIHFFDNSSYFMIKMITLAIGDDDDDGDDVIEDGHVELRPVLIKPNCVSVHLAYLHPESISKWGQ